MFTTDHLHPMVVHFPVALILLGFALRLISLSGKLPDWFHQAASLMMILGTLGCWAAYLTGEFFTPELTGNAGVLKENHELAGKTTMWIMTAASFLGIIRTRINKFQNGLKWLIFALYFAGAAGVALTGFLGGSLVYNFMIPGKI